MYVSSMVLLVDVSVQWNVLVSVEPLTTAWLECHLPAEFSTSHYLRLRLPAYSFPSTGVVTSMLVKVQCPISLSTGIISTSPHMIGFVAACVSSSGRWQAPDIARELLPAIGILLCSLRSAKAYNPSSMQLPRAMSHKIGKKLKASPTSL